MGPNFVLPADGDATGSNARNTFRCECGRVDRWTRTSGDGRTQTMTAAAKASPRTARIEMPRPCSQCQKTAVILFQGAHGLCVDCYYKFELARTLGLRIAAVGINLAGEQMDFASGFHGFTPRTAVPDLPKGPPVFNNIKVDNCVVGAANTGTMQSIDLNLTVLSIAGQEKMREGLKAFTEAVVNEKSLSAQQKGELLEQVAFLTEQSVASAHERKPAMIKEAFGSVSRMAAAITALVGTWHAVEPLLHGVFGF